MALRSDPDAIREWIYPLNHPKRDYQYNIVRKALFENTLVALPTGLGKTFVAGVVMLNCKSLRYGHFCIQALKFHVRLPLVPQRQNRVPCSHETTSRPADRSVSPNMRNSRPRCCRADWNCERRPSSRASENILLELHKLAVLIVRIVESEACVLSHAADVCQRPAQTSRAGVSDRSYRAR